MNRGTQSEPEQRARRKPGFYDYYVIPELWVSARWCPFDEFADILATGADLEFTERGERLHPDAGEGC